MAFQAKRKFPRKYGREAVRLWTKSGVVYSNFEDISLGGLRLWLEHSLKPGEILEVEFDLPTDWVEASRHRSLRRPARVVRCAARGDFYEVGVQFLDAPPDWMRQISKPIDDQAGPF